MTAFLIALAALIVGYFVYGKIVEHIFGTNGGLIWKFVHLRHYSG